MAEPLGQAPPLKPTVTEREGYLEVVIQQVPTMDALLRQFEEVLQICTTKKPSRLFVDFSPISMTN
jgi:hypothetical protein